MNWILHKPYANLILTNSNSYLLRVGVPVYGGQKITGNFNPQAPLTHISTYKITVSGSITSYDVTVKFVPNVNIKMDELGQEILITVEDGSTTPPKNTQYRPTAASSPDLIPCLYLRKHKTKPIYELEVLSEIGINEKLELTDYNISTIDNNLRRVIELTVTPVNETMESPQCWFHRGIKDPDPKELDIEVTIKLKSGDTRKGIVKYAGADDKPFILGSFKKKKQ